MTQTAQAKPATNRISQALPWHHRLGHALWAVLALLLMPMVVVYGAIMTTNTLTHLRHSDGWFYGLAWVVSWSLVGLLV